MISKNQSEDKKKQMQVISIDQLVPEDHLLRKIDTCVDFDFIYDLVEDRYSPDMGRPSLDPVTLIKIPVIQYMFGIKSMRQTIKEIEVNMAYRWFLGLDFYDHVPHFSTFGKNYKRRFEGTDLFEQIFQNILMQCMDAGLVETDMVFVDATHVKAAASRKKSKKILVAKKSAKNYDAMLREEINREREEHGKKPFDDDDNDGGLTGGHTDLKEQKQSTTDPESGWFHKGEHKEVFAYSVETACDSHGWILDYTVHPGNEHDSVTFMALYEKLKKLDIDMMIMDAGYKTPAIAKMLINDGITPVLPYKGPMTKKGFFRKYEYAYDETEDRYTCPNGQILKYSTTDRNGYREYKSCGEICAGCPYLSKCTQSRNHVKVISRHVWQEFLDMCESIRLTPGMKDIYDMRKETVERIFGTAKENHQMRYTQSLGKKSMEMKTGLTFACMNMKKLAGILWKRNHKSGPGSPLSRSISEILCRMRLFNLKMELIA